MSLVATAVRGFSQIFSLLTFGWWNPLRDPMTMRWLSTSSRMGRGADLGIWPHIWIAPAIDAAFRVVTGQEGHCLWSYGEWLERSEEERTKNVRGTAGVSIVGAVVVGVLVLDGMGGF